MHACTKVPGRDPLAERHRNCVFAPVHTYPEAALIKNIARHHSYFMGHSQNELSPSHVHAGSHLCAGPALPPPLFLFHVPPEQNHMTPT